MSLFDYLNGMTGRAEEKIHGAVYQLPIIVEDKTGTVVAPPAQDALLWAKRIPSNIFATYLDQPTCQFVLSLSPPHLSQSSSTLFCGLYLRADFGISVTALILVNFENSHRLHRQ